MRLINAKTGLLEEFLGEKIPQYAILSHTWGDEEVTYQDYQRGAQKAKKGYKKIRNTCQLATKENIPYAWVDTCCIDKTSSAELSEAINSMYRYYERSKICYAFLSDLSGEADLSEALGQCRWFTRGFTLQELIAPNEVCFYDARWRLRGSKTLITEQLSEITKIDQRVLRKQCPLSRLCVAQKLSWSSRRKTTRIEDTAYCLLGLLDLNMPLLYGEGEKAFRRLQEEIIRSTADMSIFAWKFKTAQELTSENESAPSIQKDGNLLCGVLAPSPAAFFDCSQYISNQQGSLREFSVTNIGIKIRARVLLRRVDKSKGSVGYVLPLHCSTRGYTLGLYLRQVGYDEYLRQDPFTLFEYEETLPPAPPGERYLLASLPSESSSLTSFVEYKTVVLPSRRTHILQIVPQTGMAPINPWPANHYDYEDQLFFVFRDPTRDFGIIDIHILIQLSTYQTSASEWVRCKFCALGWSSTLPNKVKFGIVEEDQHAAVMRVIQTHISDWDRDSKLLAYYLDRYQIPHTDTARISLSTPGHFAHVTFTKNVEQNLNMSPFPFWKINFSYTVWDKYSEPIIPEQKWAE
ncbi:heterokaryon incompatibility protein-domain-containing protein [Phaeosphaeriaceae sp. PMI808]|nr:heterokaryon incompatibility protein-domain-containing protein [Phaeosphaeriaceae sp. PMI808]